MSDLEYRSQMLLELTKVMENMEAKDNAQLVIEYVKFTDAIKPLYVKYCVGEKTDFLFKI